MCIKFSAIKNLIILCIIMLCFAVSNQVAFAMNFSEVSSDAKIVKALNALESVHSLDVLNKVMYNNASKKPIKIMFYTLATVSPEYANAHALATALDDGTLYILIDSRHKNAAPEEIACLIAHEVTHQQVKTSSTMDEEIQAWTNEVQQWIKFKEYNPELKTSGELTRRFNKMVSLYHNSTLAYEVHSNSHYAKLK